MGKLLGFHANEFGGIEVHFLLVFKFSITILLAYSIPSDMSLERE